MAYLNGNYREFTLDNGLLVALQNTPTQTIAGRLRVHQGALHEKTGEEGLAHFVEHTVMMGGTKNYSPKAAKEVQSRLGYLNALTNSSETRFPADMLTEDVELYLDFVSDVVASPQFDEKIVEEERQMILREVADRKSVPDYKDNKLFLEALFGANSPHVYDVAGKEEVIARATPDDLRKIHQRCYFAKNMDLVLVGGLPDNIEDTITEKFSALPAGENKKLVFPRNQPLGEAMIIHTSAPELYNHENPPASSAYFQLGFPASTFGDPDHYAVMVLAQMLCGSSNSYLFQLLCRDMGLAYHVGGGYGFDNNAGYLHVSGKINVSRIEEAMQATFFQMKSLQEEDVPENPLKLMIRNAKYIMAKDLESNAGHINTIETKIDYDYTYEKFFSGIEKVTPNAVREAAQKYLPAPDGKYVLLIRDPLRDSKTAS